MQAYTPVGWKDTPDKTTPISAANLNKMDNQIVAHNTAIIDILDALDSKKISVLTQTAYDALTAKDEDTLYFIKEDTTS